jgi:tripartite-type tricarboxylate transporter receptor subunit TctC
MVRSRPERSHIDQTALGRIRPGRSRVHGRRHHHLGGLIGIALASASVWQASGGTARAEGAEEFYKSHPLSIVIGFPPASAYDLYGRAVGRHIGKHIPGNPAILPVNKPGASSLTAANYLYSIAPKDGSTIGILSRTAPLDPLLNNPGSRLEPRKFTWLGSVGNEVSVCVAWHSAAVKSFDDLLARDFVVASAGLATDTGVFALLLKNLFGARMKIISGYPGGAEMSKAIEAGEVDGRCGWSWSGVKASKPDWLAERKINVLVQLGLQKTADLPSVPLITDLAKTNEQRQILKVVFGPQEFAWPFMAPPELPPDRKQILRAAFDATLTDPEFLEDARKMALEVNPVSGRAIEALIDELYGTPEDVVAKTRRVITAQ